MSGSTRDIHRRKMREAGLLPKPKPPPLTPEHAEAIAACRLLAWSGTPPSDEAFDAARLLLDQVAEALEHAILDGSR